MKKNLFYLFALICSMSLFTACSDDDDNGLPTDQINTTFSSTDTSNQLVLTYSGESMLGKTVTFNSTDGKTATIVLKGAGISLSKSTGTPSLSNPGVIPGETSTTLNVTLVPVGDTGYTFEGKDESNGRTINYKGSVEKGKLSLALEVKMANALVGTWNLMPYVPFSTDPDHIVWESDQPFSLMLPGAEEPWIIGPGDLLSFVGMMPIANDMNYKQLLLSVLKSVTFREDGNIVASYSDAANIAKPVWGDSPLNLAQYYVKDNKLYVLLNVDSILATLTSSATTKVDISTILPGLMELLPMISSGIPLNYSVENSQLVVYLDTTMMTKLLNIVMPLLQDEEVLAEIMKSISSDPSFGAFAGMMQGMLEQLPGVFQKTTKIEVGLNFSK